MSLDASITELMKRLADWASFPKYQLERRVDIFLTPFLASWIGQRLGGEATLVAPEFPILASYRHGPSAPDGQKPTALTVNADYLVHLQRRNGERSWVLVELKTDAQSYSEPQFAVYWNAMAHPMSKLRADLGLVRERTASRHKPKYDLLERALKHDARPAERTELAYLAPRASPVSAPECVRRADPSDPRRDRVHFLSLEALASGPDDWVPDAHRALWPHVRDLLQRITVSAKDVDAG